MTKTAVPLRKVELKLKLVLERASTTRITSPLELSESTETSEEHFEPFSEDALIATSVSIVIHKTNHPCFPFKVPRALIESLQNPCMYPSGSYIANSSLVVPLQCLQTGRLQLKIKNLFEELKIVRKIPYFLFNFYCPCNGTL